VGIDTEQARAGLIHPVNPGQGTYGFSVGAAAGPVGMPVHWPAWDQDGSGLGWADAFGGGLGERHGPGLQAGSVGR